MRSALALVVIAACLRAATTPVSADPKLVISTRAWTSAHGNCTKSLPHATVTGVPADVRARIDGVLAHMLGRVVTDATTPGSWESECVKNTLAAGAAYLKATGRPYKEFDDADWTPGLAHGRWLSARLHETSFAGGAHPEDGYFSVTFDLAHGGYPVPTGGFYTASGRASFNNAVLRAQIASMRAMGPDMSTPGQLAGLKTDAANRNVTDDQILVTGTGIAITGLGGDEASRNWIVSVPFAALAPSATPGGPLDAATR